LFPLYQLTTLVGGRKHGQRR